MKSMTASDRKTLIRLASSLPVGDETRKALINGLAQTREAGRSWDGSQPQGAAAMGNGNWTTKNLGNKCWSYLPEKDRKESDRCYTGAGGGGAPGSNAGKDGTPQRQKYNESYIKKRWKDE